MNPYSHLRLDHPPVLVVMGSDGRAQRNRCFAFDEQLRLRGIRSRVIPSHHPDLLHAALGCGVVIVHDVPADSQSHALIRQTRDSGGIVLADNSPQLLAACDGALVPTEALARELSALGRPAWVSRAGLDREPERLAVSDNHADLPQQTPAARAAALEHTLSQARRVLRPRTVPPSAHRVGQSLRIAVLLPEPFPGSGGHTTAMRMVQGLVRAGHEVTVHVDRGPWFAHATDGELARYLDAHFPPTGARVRHGRDFEPTDALIATSWTTATAVAEAPNTWARLYFVQDFEPDFHPRDERYVLAEQTYRAGLEHITIGPWLAELLRKRYGAQADHIDFGVDHDFYRPGSPVSTPRVVFYARPITARRGTALGLDALGRVKGARPDVEVVLYGCPEPVEAGFEHRNVGVLRAGELAELYASASTGLVLSFTNLSLVPLEMMAAGCPVVAVDVPAVRWFLADGENAVLADATAEALSLAILRTLDDPELHGRLVAGAKATVADLSWERSAGQFEAHVCHAVERAWGDGSSDSDVASVAGSPTVPRPVPDLLVGRGDEPVTVDGGGRVGCDITAGADGFFRVDLRLTTGGRFRRGPMVLSVREHMTAPENLALGCADLCEIVDGSWHSFEFPPLAESAGRTFHVSVECPGSAPGEGMAVLVDPVHHEAADRLDPQAKRPKAGNTAAPARGTTYVDGEPAPVALAIRTFGLHPPPSPGVGHDPLLLSWLRTRERAQAELRLARTRFERHRLSDLVRLWTRFTRPMPPVRCRPWSADDPRPLQLLRTLWFYGPLNAAGELRPLLGGARLGRSQRGGGDGPVVSP